jgi:hypothetical protein
VNSADSEKPLDAKRLDCTVSLNPEESSMRKIFQAIALVGVGLGLGLAVTGCTDSTPKTKTTVESDKLGDTDANDTKEVKIARAMSAGPADITKSARIVDTDAQGNVVVLREGDNGWTCMPGNPKVVGEPPMCANEVALQWLADFKARKPRPTNTVPGIIYMLAGATQRSDSDPYDTTSEPIEVGPHWMIMWPFDPKTSGLPTVHKSTGAYIMWAGSPYAHVHIMGRP